MHELSLAFEVIKIAESEAEKNKAKSVEEITIEVGDLSGVEAESFKSALELIVKDTILEKSLINILRSPARGRCKNCGSEFDMKELMTSCPECYCYPSEINGGREFRVVSMLVE